MNKVKFICAFIILLLSAIVCGSFLQEYYDQKEPEIIVNNKTHNLNDIAEVVNLIKKEFKRKGFKANLISIEYNEKDSKEVEEELIEENDASEALELIVSFKIWHITNQELNPDNDYEYRFDYVKKDNKWVLVNYGQG